LDPRLRGEVQIQVEMSIDVNGLLNVEATCEEAGINRKLELYDVNKVLTIEQIEKIKLIHKKESEKMKH
jgi:molecular chaperone DnaK (HSP70)